MLISFSGAQSTGKTTLLNLLKNNNILKNKYTFIDEITRTIQKQGYKINELGDSETQKLIMKSHLENSKLNNAILDRCSLDGLCYTEYLYNKGNIEEQIMNYAVQVFQDTIKKYNIIFYLKPEFNIVDDNVRSTNIEFRDEIAKLFEKNIKKYNINVILLSGTIEERIEKIYNQLKEKGVNLDE